MRSAYLRSLLLALSFFCAGRAYTQSTALYTYTTLTGTYTSIAATGTIVNGPPSGSLLGSAVLDATVQNIPIGFTFTYCTVPYFQLSAQNHGIISLANSPTVASFVNTPGNLAGIAGGAGILMPFWMDIRGSGSEAYYQTTGAAPFRVFTLQYTNVIPSGGGWTTGSGTANFQVKLYETTGVIEFWYGPSTFSGLSGTSSGTPATIGIANSTTNYKTVIGPGFATATFGTFNTAHTTTPPNGSILRWSPCPIIVTAANNSPVCPGGTVTLTAAPGVGSTPITGYTWSGPSSYSAATAVATVTPASSGTYTVVASNGSCTSTATTIVTVSPAPAPFTVTPSTSTICGPPQMLTVPGAYVWTPTAGLFNDAAMTSPYVGGFPTTTVYASPASSTVYTVIASVGSCTASATATVNVSAAVLPITGTPTVCAGATTALTSASPAGTWSTSSSSVATVSSSGVVTGGPVTLASTATITYTVGLCFATQTVTVYPIPDPITTSSGTSVVCLNATTTLNSTTAGGTWSSSMPPTASVNPTTGVVTGNALGTAVISYTLGTGCYTTMLITVNPNPLPITGPASLCTGASTTYTSGPAPGFWSAVPVGVININAISGVTTAGGTPGTTIVTYSQGGCRSTLAVTVVSTPLGIGGPTTVCSGNCTTYTNGTAGGTWSSSNTAVGTINSSTGFFCGLTAGTTTISYALSPTCFTVLAVTVTLAPVAPTGPSEVCVNSSITLTYGTPGGTWSSACPGILSVPSAGTGTVNGDGAGTCNVTYTLPSGCLAIKPMTVNPLPGTITGPSAICQNGTGTYTTTTPPGTGTWSSSVGTVGTIGATTGVLAGLTAGTTNVSFTITSTTCARSMTVTVSPAPSAITAAPSFSVCAGLTTTLSSTPAGGGWSSFVPTVATVSGTGVVTGLSAGTTVITYLTSTGCYDTAIVTVLDTPTAITGPMSVCVGLTVTINTTPAPGTWSSSVPSNGTIATSGVTAGTPYAVIGGVAAGTTTIVYTRSNGCTRSATFTVNSLPVISASSPTSVCVNSTVTMTATPLGGTWSSLSPSVSVNSATGAVTGLAPGGGTATITYSLGSGCTATRVITVNSLPTAITATAPSVCVGNNSTLGSTPSPGTWTSVNTAIGTINTTGVFTGVGAPSGTDTVTAVYVIGTGCQRTYVMTVNALPAVITGASTVCEAACTLLSSAPGTGTWSTSNTTVGVIDAGGNYCGIANGTNTVTYTLPTGCYRTRDMAVNPLPTGVSPAAPQVCENVCTTISGLPSSGTWASGTPSIATITPSGSLCGIVAGTASIIYTLPTGCARTFTATVNVTPSAISGSNTVCANATVTLNSTPSPGTWSSPSAALSVNATTGEVTGLPPGGGTATVSYTLSTGCRATHVMTVFPQPGAITASPGLGVCVGRTTTLSSTPASGIWNVVNPVLASVNASGVVTGLSSSGADTTTVYTTSVNGCLRGAVVTVYAPPSAITGPGAACVGSCVTLSATPSGGSWSSSNATIGSIGTSSGIFCGNSGPLTVNVTYTLPSGCNTVRVMTVLPLPTPPTAPSLQVCVNSTITLSGAPGASWTSSNPSVATVDAGGVVTGVSGLGTATITSSLGTGCSSSATVTVNPIPTSLTGNLQICEAYGTTTLSGTLAGGTWISSNTTVATIGSSSGIATGGASGTSTISYRYTTTGCYRTAVLTVNQLPSVFTGPTAVCVNETVTLNSTPAGGTWSSASGYVSVNATTGEVTGNPSGPAPVTATIVYTDPTTGCQRNGTMTVNPLPDAITGVDQVCVGLTTTLNTTSSGGNWGTGSTTIASISTTGVVTGNTPGTTLISYTFISTGCRITRPVTVNQLPTTITGPSGFCNFTTASYNSTPGGGTWSSSTSIVSFANPLIGDAYAGTGTAGTSTITYTLPTGCITTKDIFTIFAPYPITGKDNVCYGDTIIIGDTIAGGSWSYTPGTGNISLTPNSPNTAIVYGAAIGTVTVGYTLSTGCASSKIITVNAIPNPITGTPQVCVGLTTDLDNTTPSGSWVSSNPAIATVGSTDGLVTGLDGGVSGNTVTITYVLGTGCNAIQQVTVNPLPDVITGTFDVCEGLTTTLVSGPSGGTWTSNDVAVATVGASTGVVTGVNAYGVGAGGIGQTIITYMLPTGCIQTQAVTVNPLPSPINGPMNVCQYDMTVLSNTTTGGTWSSSNPVIASINPFGIVTGNNPGSVVISYTLPTGCIATWPMTVNAKPDTITGNLQVCAGFATNLISGPSGGFWSQAPSSMPYGTINPITGVVSGITAGLIPVSYTLGSGCRAEAIVTVVNLPAAISGNANVCEAGGTTLLSHITGGGIWSSSNPARAIVDPVTGLVTGVTAGTSTITYMIGTGCFNIRHVTVNPLPATITGPYVVCQGSQITLANATPNGTWQSGNTTVATINSATGVLNGAAPGIAPVSYILTATGCYRSVDITVNPTPLPIDGTPHICMGSAVHYTSPSAGGTWINGNPAVITFVTPTSTPAGVTVLPVTLGTAVITYQFSTGCRTMRTVTVQPLPIVFNVTGGGSFCAGGAGVPVGLDSSQPGVSYELRRGSVAAGYISGTGFPLTFGLQAVGGTYTVQATNVTSGCQRNMAGSATVVVNGSVTPTVAINVSPSDSVCPGETVTLNPTPTGGGTAPTYVWKVNGVTVGTGANYSFVPAHGDIASVVMTSNGTCITTATATISRPITVLPVGMPVAGILTSPNDSVCEHTAVVMTAMPTFGGTAPAYEWYVNGVYKANTPTYMFVPNDGDVVDYKLTSNYRCKLATTVNSAPVNIYVEPMLIPSVSIYVEPGFAVMAGKPVRMKAIAINAGPAPTFQWKVNSVPVAGATKDTFTAIFNDYDSISCVVVSSGICGNIGAHDWVFISTDVLSTGATATLPQDIRLHPNPNRGQFTVRGSTGTLGNEDVSVDITNMLGQVVYSGNMQVKQGKIDAQIVMDRELANGMYLLTLHLSDGNKTFHFVMEQ